MKQEIRNMKIAQLEDFQAWQEAMTLAELVYEITKGFPKQERFGLTSQLRRATVSVSANLAEGFGRQHSKDKEHFYVTARGSLYEVKSLLVLSEKLHYFNGEKDIVAAQLSKCLNFIGALLRAHRSP